MNVYFHILYSKLLDNGIGTNVRFVVNLFLYWKCTSIYLLLYCVIFTGIVLSFITTVTVFWKESIQCESGSIQSYLCHSQILSPHTHPPTGTGCNPFITRLVVIRFKHTQLLFCNFYHSFQPFNTFCFSCHYALENLPSRSMYVCVSASVY